MNDQRPTFWPCSADSRRKAGPPPRSLRNALTGVSVSSISVCVMGMRRCAPVPAAAIARSSSSDGVMTPVSERMSAATAKEHLLRVPERQATRGQEHFEVVQDVGRLLGDALVGLLAHRACHLFGLLLDLAARQGRVGKQPGGVGGRLVAG